MADDRLASDDQFVVLVGVEGSHTADGVGDDRFGLGQFGLTRGVERIAEVLERSTHGLARVVENGDLAGKVELLRKFCIEQQAPRVRHLTSDTNIYTDTCGSPLVGGGVDRSRVIGRIGERVGDIGFVRHRSRWNRQDHRFRDEDRDHVVGWDDHVVARAAGLYSAKHLLVRRVEVLSDRDSVLVLEGRDQVGVHVLRPVVEVQVAVDLVEAARHLICTTRSGSPDVDCACAYPLDQAFGFVTNAGW